MSLKANMNTFWQFIMRHKLLRYIVSGVTATIFDYILYEILILVLFQGNMEMAWLAFGIAGVAAVFVAYYLHNNITWRERDPGKYGIYKFLAWNLAMMSVMRPILSTFFGTWNWLYEWAYGVCQWIGLPFTYEFVASTGLFVIVTGLVAILNYVCYEKVVFGKAKTEVAGVDKSVKRSLGQKRNKA